MKTNIQTRRVLSALHKAGKTVPLWERIAKELERSTRRNVAVNLSKLALVVREGEIALVPGSVLSRGNLPRKMTVAAVRFSEAAREKITQRGEALSLFELLEKNPQGKKVRIVV